MRRSSAVKLTLLPMLASAAVAAQPASPDEPVLDEPVLCPPRAAEPILSPPGLTPTIDECVQDPCDPRCEPALAGGAPGPPTEDAIAEDPRRFYVEGDSWVFHGFGRYFWASGG